MPDWLTHTLIGWITGKTIRKDVGLVVIGSLIPDLVKITLAFTWLGIDYHHFFDPLHTPIGALLVGGILALFFQEAKPVFIALGVGITTHFILDFFLVHVSGGMKLLFPFSWREWGYGVIRYDDYRITFIVIGAALLVYTLYRIVAKRTKHTSDAS
jgi:hypothetical protein